MMTMTKRQELVAAAIKTQVGKFNDRRLNNGSNDDIWRMREVEFRCGIATTANAVYLALKTDDAALDVHAFATACGLYVSNGRDSHSDCHPGELTWEMPADRVGVYDFYKRCGTNDLPAMTAALDLLPASDFPGGVRKGWTVWRANERLHLCGPNSELAQWYADAWNWVTEARFPPRLPLKEKETAEPHVAHSEPVCAACEAEERSETERLIAELEALPVYHGWTFAYEHPGYFCYHHETLDCRVAFTPDWEEDQALPIQVTDTEGDGGPYDNHWATLPLPREGRTGQQLFEMVRPTLDKLLAAAPEVAPATIEVSFSLTQKEVDALRTVLGDMSVRSVATDHGWEERDAAAAALNKMFEAIKAAS